MGPATERAPYITRSQLVTYGYDLQTEYEGQIGLELGTIEVANERQEHLAGDPKGLGSGDVEV